MRPSIRWLTLILAGLAVGLSSGRVEPLVQAERAFARRCEADGVKAGFLAYLADESIVFRPRPVDGLNAYSEWAGSDARLTWRPVFADISRAGDLGYTTGPFQRFESRTARKLLGQGHYVSLWKRQADGSFKVVLDSGIAHPPLPDQDLASGEPEVRAPEPAPAAQGGARNGERELLALEAALSSAGAALGEPALLDKMAPDVRVYRAGHPPAAGHEAGRGLLAGPGRPASWSPMKAIVAASGDLGYVYGVAALGAGADPAREPASEASYLRIWKRGIGGWRIVLDLASPIPRPAG